MMIGTYAFYAYIVAPLFYGTALLLYSNRFKICPLIKCVRPLITCVKEPECKAALDCMAECDDADSAKRQQAMEKYRHVQFPEDPSLCRYLCFDQISTRTAEDFLECVGGSGCVEPTKYSDQCAPIQQALPFESVQGVFEGQWIKLYTNGWDIWPCQSTEFHAPRAALPEPKVWMTEWPNQANVWRMDLNWTNISNAASSPDDADQVLEQRTYTFHMSNEIYPNEQWAFPSQPDTCQATLKTRAIMWGTEAHENWYILNYDPEMRTMLIHFCAYTLDVEGFDAMTIVLRKVTSDPFTDEMAKQTEQKALELLGDKFGTLTRVGVCSL